MAQLQQTIDDTEADKKKFEWHPADGPLFEMWLKEKKPDMSEATIFKNTRLAIEFLTTKDPDVTSLEEYNNFIIDKALKGSNMNVYPSMKYFIEYKITDSGLRDRMIEGLLKPKQKPSKHESKYLTEEKMIEILNCFRFKRHRTIAMIQMITGVRAGDVLSVRKGMIMTENYEGKEVMKITMLGKKQKRNVVFIHDKIVQELIMDYIRGIKDDDMFKDYYFQVKSRKAINDFFVKKYNYDFYWQELKDALAKVGVDRADFATHDFRRCFARRVWTKYKDIHILQHMLNHSNASTTLIYLETSGLRNIDYHYEMQK